MILVAIGCLAAVLVVLALPEEILMAVTAGFSAIIINVIDWVSGLTTSNIMTKYIATFINSVLGVGKECFA